MNFDTAMLTATNDKVERHKIFQSILLEYNNVAVFNDFKNFSLYTSITDGKFLLPSEIITEAILIEIEARAKLRFDIIKDALKFLLENFNEMKNANSQFDAEQIKLWADAFMIDLLNGTI